MVASLAASTYLVDATDLQTTTVRLHHDGAGLWAGLTETVSSEAPPGIEGGFITGGLFRPYVLSTMFIIRGTGFDDVWAQIVALRRRCKPGRTVTLTRQMPDPDGTATNTSLTTTARRQTDRLTWRGDMIALLDVDWFITEPWHGPSVTIASGAGTHTILGDIRTSRMTITLAAGAARTIVNDNGYLFQFLATVPAGGVLVDVEACTATAITGGADMSSPLAWSKDALMRFEAGTNVLITDAGTFSVAYQPAYL